MNIDRLFDASRRYLHWYYTRPKIKYRPLCDLDVFLDTIFQNLSPLMGRAAKEELRRVMHTRFYRRPHEQPIVCWSTSADEILKKISEAELRRNRECERKAKRNIFRAWKVIVSQLFYYKVEEDSKARRKIRKRFSELKARGHDELTALERATGGADVGVSKTMKREDVSKSIQIAIASELPLLGAKYLFRSKRLDRLFKEIKKL